MTDDETHEEFDYPTAEEEEAEEEQLDEDDIRYLKAQKARAGCEYR